MTNIKQFIKDAIDGGYEQELAHYEKYSDQCVVLLDPSAWQACGKTRGWDKKMPDDRYGGEFLENWHTNMHRFIDLLCDGLSIDEALGKI